MDVALATNMISVGLDILCLGLMLVQGQPKTAAEYIQATSRLGCDRDRPGLVVTILNLHKPRDRALYEQFRQYHRTFYRAVEATSVTPCAARAIDRALAAVVVSIARHLDPRLTPERAVTELADRPEIRTQVRDAILDRAPQDAIAGGRQALGRRPEDGRSATGVWLDGRSSIRRAVAGARRWKAVRKSTSRPFGLSPAARKAICRTSIGAGSCTERRPAVSRYGSSRPARVPITVTRRSYAIANARSPWSRRFSEDGSVGVMASARGWVTGIQPVAIFFFGC